MRKEGSGNAAKHREVSVLLLGLCRRSNPGLAREIRRDDASASLSTDPSGARAEW